MHKRTLPDQGPVKTAPDNSGLVKVCPLPIHFTKASNTDNTLRDWKDCMEKNCKLSELFVDLVALPGWRTRTKILSTARWSNKTNNILLEILKSNVKEKWPAPRLCDCTAASQGAGHWRKQLSKFTFSFGLVQEHTLVGGCWWWWLVVVGGGGGGWWWWGWWWRGWLWWLVGGHAIPAVRSILWAVHTCDCDRSTQTHQNAWPLISSKTKATPVRCGNLHWWFTMFAFGPLISLANFSASPWLVRSGLLLHWLWCSLIQCFDSDK